MKVVRKYVKAQYNPELVREWIEYPGKLDLHTYVKCRPAILEAMREYQLQQRRESWR